MSVPWESRSLSRRRPRGRAIKVVESSPRHDLGASRRRTVGRQDRPVCVPHPARWVAPTANMSSRIMEQTRALMHGSRRPRWQRQRATPGRFVRLYLQDFNDRRTPPTGLSPKPGG